MGLNYKDFLVKENKSNRFLLKEKSGIQEKRIKCIRGIDFRNEEMCTLMNYMFYLLMSITCLEVMMTFQASFPRVLSDYHSCRK
jgi:hypothetical protein